MHSFIVKTTSFAISSHAGSPLAITYHQPAPLAHPDAATTRCHTPRRPILRYAVILHWAMVIYSLFHTALYRPFDASIDTGPGFVYDPSEYTTMPNSSSIAQNSVDLRVPSLDPLFLSFPLLGLKLISLAFTLFPFMIPHLSTPRHPSSIPHARPDMTPLFPSIPRTRHNTTMLFLINPQPPRRRYQRHTLLPLLMFIMTTPASASWMSGTK